MVKAAKANPSFTTPRGTFVYPKLNTPDTKFKKAGEYGLKLSLSEKDAATLIRSLTPLFDQAVEAGKEEYAALPVKTRKSTEFKVTPFYSAVYDEETEEETGEVEFNFKMTASGVRAKDGKEWTRKPAIFDASGKRMVKPPQIWGGTEGKVTFEVLPYFTPIAGAGISLRLSAVQILELVSGGQKSASSYGFGVEEGYTQQDGDDEDSCDDTDFRDRPSANDNDDDDDDDEGVNDQQDF